MSVTGCKHGPGSTPTRPTCQVVDCVRGGIKCGMGVVLTGVSHRLVTWWSDFLVRSGGALGIYHGNIGVRGCMHGPGSICVSGRWGNATVKL